MAVNLSRFPFSRLGKGSRVLIICHRLADVDAYAAAYGLARLLRRLATGLRIMVACPEGMSVAARKVAEAFPLRVIKEPPVDEQDLIILVDLGDPSLLGPFEDLVRGSKARRVLVDHHPLNDASRAIADWLVWSTAASSTCELVYRLYRAKGMPLTRRVAEALLLGVIYDTQHLTRVSCPTLEVVVDLCRSGASIEEAKALLRIPRDPSEAIARLKGAQRLKLYRLAGSLIGITEVGAHQASVARALLELGADFSMAWGEHEGVLRASLRATQDFSRKSGLHLGVDVARRLAEELGGSGGGHPTAASLNLPPDVADLVPRVLGLLEARLEARVEEL